MLQDGLSSDATEKNIMVLNLSELIVQQL